MGLRLGMAGSTLWLLLMTLTGLNFDGLRMSITLKLVSFVGFCSSLFGFAGLLPLDALSLFVDMFNGCACPLLVLPLGEKCAILCRPWDLITEFEG